MLPATKASSETALAWSIEQVMVSQTLNGTTKAKILDALFKKCVGIVLPSNLEASPSALHRQHPPPSWRFRAPLFRPGPVYARVLRASSRLPVFNPSS
jgi:hypothetical protein